jgi:non-canonical (house-cleaning) NTP pyrophosphatase
VLPDRIADRVRAGEELGPVMDEVLGEDDVARNQGAAGALTAGSIDREEALASAVAGALGPFVTGHYSRPDG